MNAIIYEINGCNGHHVDLLIYFPLIACFCLIQEVGAERNTSFQGTSILKQVLLRTNILPRILVGPRVVTTFLETIFQIPRGSCIPILSMKCMDIHVELHHEQKGYLTGGQCPSKGGTINTSKRGENVIICRCFPITPYTLAHCSPIGNSQEIL